MNPGFLMTLRGMLSIYILAWRRGREPAPKADPIGSRYVEAEAKELADVDAALLNEIAGAASAERTTHLESAVSAVSRRDRVMARRVMDLVRLGYTWF